MNGWPTQRAIGSGLKLAPVLLLVASAFSAHGAIQTVPPAAPVTVALVDELPGVTRVYPAAVMRRADGGDVILLMRSAASADALEAAAQVLVHSRMLHGPRPTQFRGRPIRRFMILGVRPPIAHRSSEHTLVPDPEGLLRQLHDAPETLVSNVGLVQAMTFVPRAPVRRG